MWRRRSAARKHASYALQAAVLAVLALAPLAAARCGGRTVISAGTTSQRLLSSPDARSYPEQTTCEWLIRGKASGSLGEQKEREKEKRKGGRGGEREAVTEERE